ncbi:MAG: LacI family DNA-binding transcriptional regulator [Kiritimatiellae bacterium]|nr:LacI family DNA-binding transcriptional regulator [Kiritimatiellia bacterium]
MSGETMEDVARRAGVSPMTVSLALRAGWENGHHVSAATRQRVLAAANALGYSMHPAARALRHGCSYNIGFHINLTAFQWGVPAWSNVILPMQRELWKSGYQLGFYHFRPEDSAEFGEFLSSGRSVDGIVTLGRNLSRRETEVIRASGIRAVSLYEKLAGFVSLLIDEEAAGRAAADYLYERGHRRAGILAHDIRVKRWSGRLTGFRERAAQIGLEVPAEAELLSGPDEDIAGSERRVARERFRRFLADGAAVRCLWVPSDYLAFGVVEEMDEQGLRLGRDFSVLSYDNFEGMGLAPWGKPRLTSFCPPLAEIGQRAAAILAGEVRGNEPDCLRFLPQLVERGSVAEVGAKEKSVGKVGTR